MRKLRKQQQMKMLQTALYTTGAILTVGYATKGRLWEWIPASFEKLEEAEKRILQKHVRTPFEIKKIASLGTVVVPCSDQNKQKTAKNLVLIHGFAGGNAMWAANLEHLAKDFNVYAVEWLGVGRSDRPEFTAKTYKEADDFIVSSFEKWREEMKLDKMYLCAHSMGAIFASSYAIQNPDKVHHLVLVSPAGVGHPPPPSPQKQKSWLRDAFARAWDYGITPMSIARAAGPYGPQLVSNVLQKRISFMPETSAMRNGLLSVEDLGDYIYHNWALKASGEKVMSTHLAPFAHARRPLIDQLTPETIKMPVTFIYGGHSDWMDYRHGLKVVKQLIEDVDQKAALHLVPYSGHQVFLDNPAHFNEVLVRALLSN